MRDSPSVHSQHSLNARLLRFRSQPHSEDAHALAEDLIDAGRYADARSVVTLAKPADREDATLLLLEARAHLLERDLIRAQAALLQAVKVAPSLQQAYRYLGEVLLKRGDPLRAQKTLRRALSLRADDAEARALLERAEYLAEAANDSEEALPSDLHSDFESEAAQRGVELGSEPPEAEREDPTEEDPPRFPAASEQPARRGRADEPTSQFQHASHVDPAYNVTASDRRRAGKLPEAAAERALERAKRGAAAREQAALRNIASDIDEVLAGAVEVDPSEDDLRRARRAESDQPLGRVAAGRERLPEPEVSEGRSSEPGRARAASSPARLSRSDSPDGRERLPEPPAARSGSPKGQGREGFGKRLSDFRMEPSQERATQPPAPPEPPRARAAPQRTAAIEEAPADADGGQRSLQQGPPDADQVLDVVRQLGLFEDPSSQPAAWAVRAEVETRGQRVRGALIWLWSATLLLCAAGYFGWREFVARRHATAASLVSQAHALTFVGDHAALVDAERMLRVAREQHYSSTAVTEEALFVQLERVLEDGERDTASLRSAAARATAAKISGTSIPLANLLLSAPVADATAREHALAEILGMAKGDARTLYLVGRAEERMGIEAASSHFEAATRADAKLIPAQLALAERAYERGERAAAMRALAAAASGAPTQLRVRLFRLLVSADDVPPEKLRQDMNALAEPLRKGNSMDKAVGGLVRARLARRSAEPKAALQALEAAAQSGADDARVLGWLAEEALVLGNAALAQQLASRALTLTPDNVRSRRLLARILIERGAGQQAFVLLASLANADADVQIWRAKAALLSNDPELLRAALYTLPQASGKKPEPDVQKAALRLRIETRLDASKTVLDRARALVHGAPTDPDALLALAEAALALHDPKTAQTALKQRALLLPDDVQGQTLLGRSLRLGGDVEGAEAAFRRALILRPGYVDAQTALASLLLDRGLYTDADALYRDLALRDETALSGRLGRVEALLGANKLADAQVQLEAAPEAERNTAAYREVAAKLALTRGELAPALKLLGPLAEEQPKRAVVHALYADALLRAAQLSAAGEQADAALALDPDLPEALLCRAELQLSAKKTKDALATLAKAEAALRERVRPPAQTSRRLTLLGRTLLLRKKRGDVEAAVRALREASTQPGASADVYFFLADALTTGKDKAGAADAARRYLELAPSGPYRQRAQRMLGAAR